MHVGSADNSQLSFKSESSIISGSKDMLPRLGMPEIEFNLPRGCQLPLIVIHAARETWADDESCYPAWVPASRWCTASFLRHHRRNDWQVCAYFSKAVPKEFLKWLEFTLTQRPFKYIRRIKSKRVRGFINKDIMDRKIRIKLQPVYSLNENRSFLASNVGKHSGQDLAGNFYGVLLRCWVSLAPVIAWLTTVFTNRG